MKRVMMLSVALVVTAGMFGCAKQPQKEEPKQLVPKDLNGTTSSTTFSTGRVYASEKNNYLQQCQNGNGKGCRDLGTLYELGLGVKKDPLKARYYAQKGCELGSGESCNRAGNLYGNHLFNLPVDDEKASEMYMKGCELNYAVACNNLGLRYINGKGVVRNLDLAETFLQKSQRLGSNTYNNLGYLYESKGDLAKAEEYYNKECDTRDAMACGNLAVLYQSQKRNIDAYNYMLKACNLSDADACQLASMMIYRKEVEVNNPKETMFQLSANACELGNKTGCSDTGYSYEIGLGVPKDLKKAKKYYQKACKMGHQYSCKKAKSL